MNSTHGFRCAGTLLPAAAWLVGTLFFGGCAGPETPAPADAASDTATIAAGADAGAQSIYTSDPVENGRISYTVYCASCHGSEGRGDGPVARSLNTPPPDLTQLTAASGGAFEADSVYAYIDGRADVDAHGTRDMPVWGNIWIEEDGEPVLREVVDRRINELVEYLRTLQEDGTSGEDAS